MNFFRRSPETAAIWHPESTPELDNKPLMEKAKLVTELVFKWKVSSEILC